MKLRIESRAVWAFFLPLSYTGLHAAALMLTSAPEQRAQVSLLLQTLAPLLAMVAALMKGRRSGLRAADGWSMAALAFLLWALGVGAPLFQERIHVDSVLFACGDVLLFVLYGVPLTWIAASPFRHRDPASLQCVDGALALSLGVLFFALTLSIASRPDARCEANSVELMWLLDVENLFLLVCIALRYWAASSMAERNLFVPLAVYALAYLLIAAFNNHVVTQELQAGDGSLYEVLIPLPFTCFVAACAAGRGTVENSRRTLARRTRYVRSASPLMLCLAVLGTGLALARTDYGLGVAGVLAAVCGYGLRSILRDVRHVEVRAQLRDSHAALEAISLIDALTGVANRRALDLALLRQCEAAMRTGRSLGVLLIDIDHFKLLNDTSGHAAGDRCLREVAQALRSQLRRPEDLLARYGGEEFVVLLPNTDREGCIKMAEDLRRSVVALRIANPGTASQLLSVSVGAACETPRRGDDPLALLSEADRALYQAKRGGRNRVEAAWMQDAPVALIESLAAMTGAAASL